MSRTLPERTRPRRRKKQNHPGLLAYTWPFLLFCALTPLAVRAASLLALFGPGALRMLIPFVAIVHAGWAMWAQFPVYGLLVSCFAFRRRTGAGFLAALLLHAAGAAWALNR